MSPGGALYRIATDAAGLVLPAYLRRRARGGKEFVARLAERRGIAGLARPHGPLVWIHGASVGETVSILPLIAALRAARPDIAVLVTSVTVTAARLLAQRLGGPEAEPERSGALPGTQGAVRHQFLPLDRAAWVRRFLRHWRPDLGILVESELWPNLIRVADAEGVPLVQVNGRLSARSFARWRKLAPGLARDLLRRFRLCLAQGEGDAERFAALGARDVRHLGNLKYAAPPLPADAGELARLRSAIAGRPVWMMASTHPGEEAIALAAHKALAPSVPGLLTIIAPRHPERGEAIAAEARALGLSLARRGRDEAPHPPGPDGTTTAVWLADTLGELGLFYRLAGLVVMGGSFIPHGGQNPLEPARLDCVLAFGPHMGNFPDIAAALETEGGAERLSGPDALAPWLASVLADRQHGREMAQAAARVAARQSGVLDRVTEALLALLPPR